MAELPRRVHRRVDPLAPLHRPDAPRSTCSASGSSSSASATAPPTSRSSCPARRCRTRSSSRPGPAPGSCRSTSYGLPADKYFVTSPHIPLAWQRKVVQKMQFMTGSNPELYGLPKPNHKFFEAHPTQSVELPLRLGSGDIMPKPNVTRLDGATVHFEDGTSGDFDVIVYATGYNITFPFFDEDFISAPDNRIRLFKRMFKPGVDDLVFMGFAQAVPTLFPFVEAQARLLAAYAVGRYALAVGGRDGGRPSTPTTRSTWATSSTGRGTPSRWTTSSTSTTCGSRRSPRAWRGRRSAHERHAAGPRRPAAYRPPRGARPPPAPADPAGQPRLDQHRRHLAARRASPARRSTSTSTTRPARSRP